MNKLGWFFQIAFTTIILLLLKDSIVSRELPMNVAIYIMSAIELPFLFGLMANNN